MNLFRVGTYKSAMEPYIRDDMSEEDKKAAEANPMANMGGMEVEVEKLKKDRSVFIFAGKPSQNYQAKYGTESKIQIGDKFTDVSSLQFALTEARQKLRPELQDYVVVALKVDKETNTGLVTDIKEELRELNMVKIIYITAPGSEIDN